MRPTAPLCLCLALLAGAGPALLAGTAEARPNPGGLGGPASGAGVRPGAGWGRPGVGPGGVGGPASGAGVLPGAGWGTAGPGLTRAPAAAYGAAVVHPGWAAGGYWAARPWPYGWYGTAPLAWGVAGMATAATITTAVNSAAAQQSPVIVVPGTSFVLNYASVTAQPPSGVTFNYQGGGLSGSARGDCRKGLVNGQPTTSAEAAQLLNAACQVAYGAGG